MFSVFWRGNKAYVDHDGTSKYLGEINGTTFFVRKTKANYFKKYGGFGFNKDLLKMLKEKKVTITVEYTEEDTITIYRTTPEFILERGTPYDYGEEKQCVLNETEFDVISVGVFVPNDV